MKYLLVGINAKYIHSNLALQCLNAYAVKYTSVKPVVAEYTINMPVSDIVQGIYLQNPDFIAFSVYIWNVDIVMQVVRDIKTLLPDTIIYLGGPEVSYDSETILNNNPEVSGIMLGEGEQTFTSLLAHYESSSPSLNDIKGICFRDSATGTITTNDLRSPIDLSTVPFPYTDLHDYDNKIIYYETSRGCPYGCSYCLSSVDKTIRFRDMNLVREELLFFLNANVPQVKLVDRTFNVDHRRSVEILNFLKTHDNGITNFHFEIAGDILTDEEIEIINSLRPGLIQLEIGVQSTNECTLNAINRRTDMEKLRANVKRLLDGGKVHLHLDLIAGLPHEDLTSFKKSFNDVYAMQSHELQLGFLKMLKGAPINSLIDDEDIKYSGYAPYEVLSTKNLSYNDICELKRVEQMLEIYHNSCQFMRSETFILSHEKSPYDMYYALADYYNVKNQPIMQCKRAVRYEILIEYAMSVLKLNHEEISHLRNLLTLDYYSREKAKARPSFAADINMHKNIIRQLEKDLEKENPHSQFHIEPVWNSDKYAIFDYSNKSVITGNIIPVMVSV